MYCVVGDLSGRMEKFYVSLIDLVEDPAILIERIIATTLEEEPEKLHLFDKLRVQLDKNIEDLLNQARKFKVGMVLAHQNLEQLSQKLKATILASTSVKIAGGVSFKDAGVFAKEMNCSPEFIQSARKRKDQTEFACWVRNLTDRALKISVPLGAIEKLPVMEESDYQKLIDKNRSLYSGVIKKEDLKDPSGEKGVDGFELGEPENLL